jgi:hypothetical protein
MAYDIVKRLKEQNNQTLLATISNACSAKEKAKGQLHKAFEVSFDAKVVYSFDFCTRK